MKTWSDADKFENGKYNTARERYGQNLTDSEILECIDDEHLIDNDLHLVLEKNGQWMAERNKKFNPRGDRATILQRRQSCESVGIVLGIRRGAWVMSVGPDSPKMRLLHWASLLEGLNGAWEAEKKEKCNGANVGEAWCAGM